MSRGRPSRGRNKVVGVAAVLVTTLVVYRRRAMKRYADEFHQRYA